MDRKKYVLLLQKGFTQKQLAELCGVHQPKISDWLNGNRIPTSNSLYKLAEVLDEDPDELYDKLKYASELK